MADSPESGQLLPDIATLRALSAACGYDSSALAARLGVSPRHLRRLFVDHLGCSASSWLREERLQCALRSLQSARSVKEVAHALGFRSASQFCRDFRARFGVTPSEHLPRNPWDTLVLFDLSFPRPLAAPSALDRERARQLALRVPSKQPTY